MKPTESAGPDVDVDFFNEVRTLFDKYPDAAQRYSIGVRHTQVGKMKIDFNKQHGVSRIEGDRIVTEFKDISDLTIAGSKRACREWYREDGRWKCAAWWWE